MSKVAVLGTDATVDTEKVNVVENVTIPGLSQHLYDYPLTCLPVVENHLSINTCMTSPVKSEQGVGVAVSSHGLWEIQPLTRWESSC